MELLGITLQMTYASDVSSVVVFFCKKAESLFIQLIGPIPNTQLQ